jgi:spermidine/putrescine-binding protein
MSSGRRRRGPARSQYRHGPRPARSRTDNGPTWGQDFAAGKIGIMPGGYGQVVNIAKAADLGTVFADAPLPGATGNYSTFDGGDFAIPAAAKNPSGAWEFITWAMQEQTAAAVPRPRRDADPHRPAHPGILERAPARRGGVECPGQRATRRSR